MYIYAHKLFKIYHQDFLQMIFTPHTENDFSLKVMQTTWDKRKEKKNRPINQNKTAKSKVIQE